MYNSPQHLLRAALSANVRCATVILCIITGLSTFSDVLGSMDTKWAEVASNHVHFAKVLANRHQRFDEDLIRLTEKHLRACQLIDENPTKLDAETLETLRLFADAYCEPWFSTWAEALGPCHSEHVPSWCDNKKSAQKRLSPSKYYDEMRASIKTAASPSERYNLMAIVVRKVGSDMMVYYFPPEQIDAWLTAAVSEYLESAPGSDVVDIASLIQTSLGRRPSVADGFQRYLKSSSSLSSEERSKLQEIVSNLRDD